jgi:three-Cys-motif partner protein
MKPLEYYSKREQTYLKHFFLERYLERVGFNICSFLDEFVYVDGFSGPWKSTDENFEDTSFMIAIRELRKIREGVVKAGRPTPRIRCLFVEKDPTRYRELERATRNINDMKIEPIEGEFEDVIPKILRFVGNSFSLVFIDPTGWTGFGLKQISPLLMHRPGEVIINFMFDFVNRNFGISFDELFGGPGWKPRMTEDETIQLYTNKMKVAGQFDFVTSTRILKPTSDRTYFYLVYGTRHWKGLYEFRHVEKKFIEEQERVRTLAKQALRVAKTGQRRLFEDVAEGAPSYETERHGQLTKAFAVLRTVVSSHSQIRYEDLLSKLLELPLVWESDINEMVWSLSGNELVIHGLKPREKRLKRGHIIRPIT